MRSNQCGITSSVGFCLCLSSWIISYWVRLFVRWVAVSPSPFLFLLLPCSCSPRSCPEFEWVVDSSHSFHSLLLPFPLVGTNADFFVVCVGIECKSGWIIHSYHNGNRISRDIIFGVKEYNGGCVPPPPFPFPFTALTLYIESWNNEYYP